MKSLTKALILFIMISLVGFTIMDTEEALANEPVKNEENSVKAAAEKIKENVSIIDYVDKGSMVASWYGPGFHGRLTANGEIYNQMAFTAAHKKLRFGTLLRVTNPDNGKSVVVRINDRGPYIRGRNLDLSKAAAIALGMMQNGVIKVKVEEISLKGANFPVITLN